MFYTKNYCSNTKICNSDNLWTTIKPLFVEIWEIFRN